MVDSWTLMEEPCPPLSPNVSLGLALRMLGAFSPHSVSIATELCDVTYKLSLSSLIHYAMETYGGVKA